ncbi:MAG: TrmO family methyltransferase [Thioalkalivibrionaceae bacterium]
MLLEPGDAVTADETGHLSLTPVAVARTPWRDKFGIPRQAGLVDNEAYIELCGPFARDEAIQGLELCSHVWVIFGFHRVPRAMISFGDSPTSEMLGIREGIAQTRSLKVRPPRLGGNRRIGVFASRSTHRPNGLGLSVVRLIRIEPSKGQSGPRLRVAGADWVDGTPIFDIKPYLPWADSIPDATTGFADQPPIPRLRVRWWGRSGARVSPAERRAISQAIALDPRPAYQAGRPSGVRRWFFLCHGDVEVKFCVINGERRSAFKSHTSDVSEQTIERATKHASGCGTAWVMGVRSLDPHQVGGLVGSDS